MTTPVTYAAEIEGWMTAGELDWLYARAQEMDNIVEVGSYCGRSSFALLSGCEGTVTCVDTWEPAYQWSPVAESRYSDFIVNVGHFDNLRVMQRPSVKAARFFLDESVDMVFLDGDHSYEGITADIDAWLPKARKLICGHDWWNGEFPGVTNAVRERFAGRFYVAHHSIWAVNL